MEIHDVSALLEPVPGSKKSDLKPCSKTPLRTDEFNLLARTLGGLLEGGVPIVKALDGLEKAAAGKRLKSFLAQVAESVRRGLSLSAAFSATGMVPSFFCQPILGGEISGRVPETLHELARYTAKEQALKRSVRDALVYPAFIVAVGFATLLVLTCFVLPRLEGIYKGFGTDLPLITVLIMAGGRAFLPFSVIAGGVLFFTVLSLKKSGRIYDLLLKMPYAADFFKGYVRVRFSRLLAMQLDSGVPILEALGIARNTLEVAFFRADVESMRSSLAAGGGIAGCLENISWMDDVSKMLVVSGEETGRLGEAFFQIARDTEIELEARIHVMIKLLEPTLILVMGLSIGFVVTGTVLPIFEMSGAIR